jgi:hypothetical protein
MAAASGEAVPAQRLSNGDLCFLAADVPAMGSKVFLLSAAKDLENDEYRIEIDSLTGSVKRFTWKKKGLELIDTTAGVGLNGFIYVAGRDPANAFRATMTSVRTLEKGPLLNSLQVTADLRGCYGITAEYRLWSGTGTLEIINTIDKQKTYDPEGLHIAFPLQVRNGEMMYDLSFGVCSPEAGQVKGSNKNFMTAGNWTGIFGARTGLIMACPDAPLIEAGRIMNDPVVFGWVDKLDEPGPIYSYAMNNYWETNFHAGQEGPVTLRYGIKAGESIGVTEAERFGVEQRQPLLVVPADRHQKPLEPLFGAGFEGLVVFSVWPLEEPGTLLIGVYCPGPGPATLHWDPAWERLSLSDPGGLTAVPAGKEVVFRAGSVKFLKITRSGK